jgi:formate-dependent nitrite reductase membrane component NrfD
MGTEPIYPIKNLKYIRPQKEWKEILALYLYLAGMGAGSFIIGTLIHWLGVKLNPSLIPSVNLFGYPLNLSELPIFWGPVMVAISAPCLVLDLGIKWRFMYACLNPRTSWVARGFIILSMFIVLGLIVLAKSILPFEWLHTGSFFWVILEIITLAFAFGTAFYTGMLLKATKSIPLWNTYLLPLLFLVSALSTGSMAIILSTLGSGLFSHDSGSLKVLIHGEQMFVVIEGIVLYLFLSRRYKAAGQGKDSVQFLLFGEMKLIFWFGIVLLGLIFPIILENIASLFRGNVVFIFIAGIFLLCGGFFLRLGILHTGIKERIPMHRLMDIQYNAIKNPKPEYRNLNLPVWNYNLKKGDWNAG